MNSGIKKTINDHSSDINHVFSVRAVLSPFVLCYFYRKLLGEKNYLMCSTQIRLKFIEGNLMKPILFYIIYVLQACRRCICMENNEDECIEENGRKVVTMSSDMGEVCEFLLEIMSSESHLDINTGGHHAKANRLMEETDLFSKLVAGNREV